MIFSRKTRAHETLRSNMSLIRDEYTALTSADRTRNSEADSALSALFKETLDDSKAKISRDQVRTAARVILTLLPNDHLPVRVQTITKAITDLVGQNAIAASVSRKIGDVDALPENERRALAGELQRIRASASIEFMNAELFRTRVLTDSLIFTILCMLILGVCSYALAAAGCTELTLVPVAAFFGALGAWISVASRIRDADPLALSRHAELSDTPTSSVWLSPVFGGIGAILLFGCIKAKIIAGTFSTNFGMSAGECVASEDASTVFAQLTSDENIGFTVTIALLSLAAGWSERFVPDLLDWVGKRSKPSDKP